MKSCTVRQESLFDPTVRQKSLFYFLKQHKSFTISKISTDTGYKASTIHTYLSKKLLNHWVERNGDYSVKDEFKNVDINEFIEHMNQISSKCRKA